MASARLSRRIAWSCQAGMALGLALVIAGGLWTVRAKPSDVWSAEQAKEFQAAGNALHDLTYNRSEDHHSAGEPGKEQLAARAAAKERFDRIEAALAEARAGHQRAGTSLVRWGLAAMVVFGIGYLSMRGE